MSIAHTPSVMLFAASPLHEEGARARLAALWVPRRRSRPHGLTVHPRARAAQGDARARRDEVIEDEHLHDASDSERCSSVAMVNSPSRSERRWLAKCMRSQIASSTSAASTASMSPGINRWRSRSSSRRRMPLASPLVSALRSG